VRRIDELGTLAVTSKRCRLRRNKIALMMEALSSSETSNMQKPQGVTSQKTELYVDDVRTSQETLTSTVCYGDSFTVLYADDVLFETLKVSHCVNNRLVDGGEVVSLTKTPE
jgi:hypothetical protein